MKKDFRILLVVVCLLCSTGCREKSSALSVSQYAAYVTDEAKRLKIKVKSGVFEYAFQYKPAPYIAITEDLLKTSSAINERVDQLHNTIWFNVTISLISRTADPLKYGTRNLEEYNSRLNYFLIQAAKNFQLTYGGSKMEQIGYQFENNYNIKPEAIAIVGFQIPDKTPVKDLRIEYFDGLFNAGIMKAVFEQSTLLAVPNISFDK